ncbi:MAG: hypothetical protein HXY34_03350 [Candidatus Thorarchaeota archaeon]|nr:hypothetical protein [Candidatus Thorarchaeota archaeon]
MPTSYQVLTGLLSHIALMFLNFCVLLGVIESIRLFVEDIPPVNALILAYMLVHTFLMLSVQMGIQILELIRIRRPTLLISYYFQFSDEETIPVPMLDPTKSRLAVLILLLVVSGGPILYPLFAVYGFILAYAHIVAIALEPSAIVHYFELFLNWMPPILGIIVMILIVSIVIIEFKHI